MDPQLLKTRLALETRSRELFERLRGRRQGLHVVQAAELLDQLQLAAERDLEVNALNRDMEELSKVRRALENAEAGTLGICTDCEEPISKRRLEVMPWATRCIACQEKLEESADSQFDSASSLQFEMA